MAEQWQSDVLTLVQSANFIQASLSQLRHKDGNEPQKTTVRKIQLRGKLFLQFEFHYSTKVMHENVEQTDAGAKIIELMLASYRQCLIKTTDADVQILFSKKGKATILRKAATARQSATPAEHNRAKNYVLNQQTIAPFLVELGIVTQEGHVAAKKQDKYRQINRFLEMVSDVFPHLPTDRPIRIIDFGCGKSYLTFALYHYLVVEQQRQVSIVGLDLKADVIAFCSSLAEKLGYDQLRFQVGDINEYDEQSEVDMVVTLHACDTATDAAIGKAVEWGAQVILSVPCCQHELFSQIKNEALHPLLKHGLLKERFSALVTDAARAQLLEVIGYKVQIVEFIDPEHTPKNILIRAVKNKGNAKPSAQKWEEYRRFKDELQIRPYLENIFASRFDFS